MTELTRVTQYVGLLNRIVASPATTIAEAAEADRLWEQMDEAERQQVRDAPLEAKVGLSAHSDRIGEYIRRTTEPGTCYILVLHHDDQVASTGLGAPATTIELLKNLLARLEADLEGAQAAAPQELS